MRYGSEPEAESYGPGCHAFGCPLAGGITESTKGGGPWFCRFHFGVHASMWPELSADIRSGKLGQATDEPTQTVGAMKQALLPRIERRRDEREAA